LTSDFSVQEVSRTLSSKIPPEERAMSVAVDAISGVSGLLRPGDRVDILGTFPIGTKDQVVTNEKGEDGVGYVTMTMLQNVTLLATGQELSDVTSSENQQGRGNSYATVTVSVTVDEAELLTIAQTRGKMTLLLRNREDVDVSTVSKRTLREVMEELEIIQRRRNDRIPKAKKAPAATIDITRGDKNPAK